MSRLHWHTDLSATLMVEVSKVCGCCEVGTVTGSHILFVRVDFSLLL